ncbi:MAG TPA: hypothetical protein VMT37_03525 [Solirubrobacterales bacterium]|nr:hypothetical protein [Solirubrobacterales bacterium]
MHRKQAEADPAEAHAARVAWWAAFVTTAVLALALGFVRTANAATLPASPPLSAPGALIAEPEEAEEEDGEEELEDCEVEVEFYEATGDEPEEEVEGECEAEEEDEAPPPSCRLESTDTAVSADLVHRRLHLAVRYSAFKPTPVAVSYFLRGSKGPLTLPVERKRFAGNGVFRATEALSAAQAKKVAAARSFTVQVRPSGAPGYCHEYFDQDLSVRRGGASSPIWTDSDSSFRHARHA